MDQDNSNGMFTSIATPSFSASMPIGVTTDAQRNFAPLVHFMPSKLIVRISQPVTNVITYRFLLFHLKAHYVFSGVYDPLVFLTPAATVTNFIIVAPYIARDQLVPYDLVTDKTWIVDTTNNHDALISNREFKIPAHDVSYDPDDSAGLTGLGYMLAVLLTNATSANAGFTWNFFRYTKYQLQF